MMNANLLQLAQQALGGDFAKLAGQFLGESESATSSALGGLLPAVLGGIAQKGATPDGASALLSMINGANLDTSVLGNVAGLFGAGGSGANALMKAGTASLVPALFGDKSSGLVNALTGMSGVKSTSATNLLAIIVPLILAFLKKFIGEKGLNANSLSSLMSGQGQYLQGSLDNRITSALGFANPAAFLGSLGGQAADAARRTGTAVAGGATAAAATATAAAAQAKSGFGRWLPWLIALGVIFFLWQWFAGRSTPSAPAPAPMPKAAAPAPAPAPAPTGAVFPGKIYFETGSAAVGAAGSATINALAEAIKKDNLKVSITGYTDKTGDVAKNEELAKSRALAVRDALKAAGVAEATMETRPPMFVEVGAGGSDAEARRVEVTRQ
jgi:outer membrane protein OmpA-like peptidoglycan-associated protein